MSASLRDGIANLDDPIIRAAMGALPAGTYKAMLLSAAPQRIVPSQKGDYFFEEQIQSWGVDGFWGVPHYTKNEYYRTYPIAIAKRSRLFEFIVPMFPKNYLSNETTRSYEAILNGKTVPTVLAVSVLDVKGPATWSGEPEVTEHWCLAHYVLDGHHKLYAASQVGKPISLLSFLAVDKGVSSADQIARVLEVLAKTEGLPTTKLN